MNRVVLALVLATPLLAQSVPPSARDVRAEITGSAFLSGIVQSDDESSRPLRRASVRLTSDRLITPRVLVTGDDGRFEYANLPPGQYSLYVYRTGFQSMNYGAKRPGGSGSSIVLGEGQRLRDVVVRLPRYAAISGTVYDQNGEPAQGVAVEVMRYSLRNGVRVLGPMYGRAQRTDDRGVYRTYGLEPGDFYVAAGPDTDVQAPAGLERMVASDIDQVLRAATSGMAAALLASSSARQFVSFAPIFYPGSADPAGASAIAVKPGEERTGVDIRLQLVPTARVDGTVTGPDGQPMSGVQVFATMISVAGSMELFRVDALGTARSDAQGRFTFPAVPPGQYLLSAQAPARGGSAAGGPSAGPLWGMADLPINGSDQAVTFAMQPGMTVSGRVVFDGTTLARPDSAVNVRVTLSAVQIGPGVTMGAPVAAVNADGTFAITGAAPGRFRLTTQNVSTAAMAGWSLRSAMVGGVDSLDVPLDIRPGQNIDDAVLTFTDHPAELSGTLLAPSGVPTSDYFVIVFAADRAFWVPPFRRVVMTRPTNVGRYLVRNLPPGAYCIAALTDVAQGEWLDPAFLEPLVAASVRVTIGEGEKKAQDLRIR